MNISKQTLATALVATLAVGVFVGIGLTRQTPVAQADSSMTGVDRATLGQLYEAVFGRPIDQGGANFYAGKGLGVILGDFINSPEHRYYGALFKAVKSYEEAQRAPGTLSSTDKQSYLDLIDSALSNLLAWVATLPDQNPCDATIDPIAAREAVQEAYDQLDASGKASAQQGVLNADKHIGAPNIIPLIRRCLNPSVTPLGTPVPATSIVASPYSY